MRRLIFLVDGTLLYYHRQRFATRTAVCRGERLHHATRDLRGAFFPTYLRAGRWPSSSHIYSHLFAHVHPGRRAVVSAVRAVQNMLCYVMCSPRGTPASASHHGECVISTRLSIVPLPGRGPPARKTTLAARYPDKCASRPSIVRRDTIHFPLSCSLRRSQTAVSTRCMSALSTSVLNWASARIEHSRSQRNRTDLSAFGGEAVPRQSRGCRCRRRPLHGRGRGAPSPWAAPARPHTPPGTR
jgi:hypothetical protein